MKELIEYEYTDNGSSGTSGTSGTSGSSGTSPSGGASGTFAIGGGHIVVIDGLVQSISET